MYPSGAWRGFWEQPGYGRQLMHELALRFAGGQIEGEGLDIVGPFHFRGRYDDSGNIALVKQYLDRHQVEYRGVYDGEGSIFGRWQIGDFNGAFALKCEKHNVPADAPILEIGAARK